MLLCIHLISPFLAASVSDHCRQLRNEPSRTFLAMTQTLILPCTCHVLPGLFFRVFLTYQALPHLRTNAPPSSNTSPWFCVPLAVCVSMQGLFKGFFPAVLTSAFFAIGGVLLFFPVTRKLIARSLPGEGRVFVKRGVCSSLFFLIGKSARAASALYTSSLAFLVFKRYATLDGNLTNV